jgi:hypothetical protein
MIMLVITIASIDEEKETPSNTRHFLKPFSLIPIPIPIPVHIWNGLHDTKIYI